MTISKGIYGQYIISDIINGYLITRQYFGYTKREAIKSFQKEVKK